MHHTNHWLLSAIILLGASQSILAASLVGYNGGPIAHSPSVPLENGTELITTSWFNSSQPTVFYIHGYREVITDDTVTNISSALYDVYGGVKNIIVLNWDEEATQGILDRELGYLLHAIPGAEIVGRKLAELIVILVGQGINKDIHIIGHSLGAHLAGICGSKAVDLGFSIPRITGLDPAGPVFELAIAKGIRLGSCDGSFVDIYHTNSGNLGIKEGTGDVDIWINYSTDLPVIQPGCETESTSYLQNLCSHQRSVFYFAESIRNSAAFYGGKGSYESWLAGRTMSVSALGESIDTSIIDNYYLTTNPASPYGKGVAGAKARATYSSTRRRKCRNP